MERLKRLLEAIAFIFIIFLVFWVGLVGLLWAMITDIIPGWIGVCWDIFALAWKKDE